MTMMQASSWSNARWVMLAQGVKIATQLMSVTILARLLAPQAYGLMALAMIAANLAYLFRDLGFSAAVIQAETLTERLLNTLYWSCVALGCVIALILAACAPWMAWWFAEPTLRSVLWGLAGIFPVISLSAVPQALLERRSAFSNIALAEVSGALSGLLAALLAAWWGAGVLSLVLQMVVNALVTTGVILLQSDFRPAWQWQAAAFRQTMRFSGNLSLFNLVLYLARNADSMVIGRMLGAATLGVYALATRIMLFPLQNLTHVAARALYPIMSRYQASPHELAARYLKTFGFIAFLTAPLMAGLFVLREPFVQLVLGARWHQVSMVLAWLAPVGLIQALVSTTGTVLMALGRTDMLLRLGLLGASLQIAGFVVGARWGIEGVAIAGLVANLLNAVPAFYVTGRFINVTPWQLLQRLMGPLALSALMVLLVQGMQPLVQPLHLNEMVLFLLLVTMGVLVYAVGGYWLLGSHVQALKHLLGLQKIQRGVSIE